MSMFKGITGVVAVVLIMTIVSTSQLNEGLLSQPLEDVSNYGFSIVHISDTQHICHDSYFEDLTDWINTKKDDYNIKAVIHTGDIIDEYQEASIIESEYLNANNSFSIFLDNGIPYTYNAGNHDQLTHYNGENETGTGKPDGTWQGKNYLAFNSTYLSSKDYWVDDLHEGKNTAIEFIYGVDKFLIVNLEYWANSSAIAWAENLFSTYSDYNIIACTHSFVNGDNGYGWDGDGDNSWELAFNQTVNNYSNIIFTLSGHSIYDEAGRITIGSLEQIYWNRQQSDNYLGGASVRIITFNYEKTKIQVRTYIQHLDLWVTSTQNHFEFDMNLQ